MALCLPHTPVQVGSRACKAVGAQAFAVPRLKLLQSWSPAACTGGDVATDKAGPDPEEGRAEPAEEYSELLALAAFFACLIGAPWLRAYLHGTMLGSILYLMVRFRAAALAGYAIYNHEVR